MFYSTFVLHLHFSSLLHTRLYKNELLQIESFAFVTTQQAQEGQRNTAVPRDTEPWSAHPTFCT
jgi:hypothetical protein